MADFELDSNIDNLVKSVDAVSSALWDSKIVKETREALKENLDNVEISTEERDKLYINYIEQLTFGLLDKSLVIATTAKDLEIKDKNLAVLDKELLLKDKEIENMAKDAALKDKNLAVLDKELLLKDKEIENMAKDAALKDKNLAVLDKELLLKDKNLALIDRQIEGFDNNIDGKIVNSLTGLQSMLAQNDVVPSGWMVDATKNLIKSATDDRAGI